MSEIKNQRVDAMAYLEKHKILRLFDILGVKLAQQVHSIHMIILQFNTNSCGLLADLYILRSTPET